MSNEYRGNIVFSKDATSLMRDIADLDVENPCITAAAADPLYFYFLDQYARKIYKVFKATGTPIRTISLSDEPFMYQRSFFLVDNLHEADDYATQACWADDSTGYFMGWEEDMKLWHFSRWTLHVVGDRLIVSEPIESRCWVYTKTGELLQEFCVGQGGISGNGSNGNSRFSHVLAAEEVADDIILYVSHDLYFGMRADDYSELPQFVIPYPSINMGPENLPGTNITTNYSMGRGHHARAFWSVEAYPVLDGEEWTGDDLSLVSWAVPTFSKFSVNDEEAVLFTNNVYTLHEELVPPRLIKDGWWTVSGHNNCNVTGGCLCGDSLYVGIAGGQTGSDPVQAGGVLKLNKDTLQIEGHKIEGSPRFSDAWGQHYVNPTLEPGTGGGPWGNGEAHAWWFAEAQISDSLQPGSVGGGQWRWGETVWSSALTISNLDQEGGIYEWGAGSLFFLRPRIPDASIGCCVHTWCETAGEDDPIVNLSNAGWLTQSIGLNRAQLPDPPLQMHWMWPSCMFSDGGRLYVISNRLQWGDVLKNSSAIWAPIEGAIDPEDKTQWRVQRDSQLEVLECAMISLDLTVEPEAAQWGDRRVLKVRPGEQIQWHRYFDTYRESLAHEPEGNDLAGSYVSVENLIELREAVERVIPKHKTPIENHWPRYYYIPFQRDERPDHWYPLLLRPRTEGQPYVLGEVPDDIPCDEWNYYEDGGPYTGWTETHHLDTTDISKWIAWSTSWWANLGERINDEGQLEIALALEFTGSADVTIYVQENLGPKRYASVYIGSSLNYFSIVQEAAPGFEDYPPCNQSAYLNAYYLAMDGVSSDYGLDVVEPTDRWKRPNVSDLLSADTLEGEALEEAIRARVREEIPDTPIYDLDIGEIRKVVDFLKQRDEEDNALVLERIPDE